MIIVTKIRKIMHLPGLHIKAQKDKCISCNKCSKACPKGVLAYGFKNEMKEQRDGK